MAVHLDKQPKCSQCNRAAYKGTTHCRWHGPPPADYVPPIISEHGAKRAARYIVQAELVNRFADLGILKIKTHVPRSAILAAIADIWRKGLLSGDERQALEKYAKAIGPWPGDPPKHQRSKP